MFNLSTVMNRSLLRTAMFIIARLLSNVWLAAGDLLPGHQLQPAHTVRDIGLAIGDLLRLRPRGATENDHAGAEALAGVVEEWAGADQHAFRFEIVDEGMMLLDKLLLRRRRGRPRLDDLIIDDPALLACPLAHSVLLPAIVAGQG